MEGKAGVDLGQDLLGQQRVHENLVSSGRKRHQESMERKMEEVFQDLPRGSSPSFLLSKATEGTFSTKCRCHSSQHPNPCPGETR